MLVYYSVLVFILLAAICSSLAKKGIYKDLFFQIAAFLLFLVMAIRDDTERVKPLPPGREAS